MAGTRIGIVAFADFAQLLVPPTTDKKADERHRQPHDLARHGIGAAALQALDAIAAVDPDAPPVDASIESQADQGGGPGPVVAPPRLPRPT